MLVACGRYVDPGGGVPWFHGSGHDEICIASTAAAGVLDFVSLNRCSSRE